MLDFLVINTNMINHITKLQSRQRVKPAAVQPIVMLTAHWAGEKGSKNEIGKKKGVDCNHN